MSKYQQKEMLIDTQLDEIGRTRSLNRFKNESKVSFKDRIYLSNTVHPAPILSYYNFALNNHLGLFQKKVFRIDLIDSKINEKDLPRIEIKANTIEVWKEKSKESVLFLNLRDEKYKFLINVKEALSVLDFIKLTDIDYSPYLYSKSLSQGTTDAYKGSVVLKDSKLQDLGVKYIESYNTNNPIVSFKEKTKTEDIALSGDFYLDRKNGLLYTFDENKGFASIMYQQFPFYIESSPALVFELNDETLDKVMYNEQINEDGVKVFSSLNSYGSNLINEVLQDNRMYWDK